MSAGSGRVRVLVVEDAPLNLELVVDLLEAAGFSVSTAGTAELGLEQWLLSRGKKGQPVSRTVERLKSQGYTIAVKYKLFKVIL